ncbi:MAG: hypothetical protein LBV06_10660 [Propionibacteriaceae bacterium]|jgi:hypothetical protein|nr:hypothetical protein [Propionibacteriaceae bacterium]
MTKRQRKPASRRGEAERQLRAKTVKRREPDLELLGRIIVEAALADAGPARSGAIDHTGLLPRPPR